jgi:hypothetical protein
MTLRQRKGKREKETTPNQNNDNDDDKKKKTKQQKQKQTNRKKKSSGKNVLLFLCFVLGTTGLILSHFYNMYGPSIFLGKGWKDFKIEPYQWRQYLDAHDKTILLVGGPHRSGTTILWKAIAAHPEAVGFGSTFDTGADFSEGILFQDVYPAFGVGMEFSKSFSGAGSHVAKGEEAVDVKSGGGLGQYALLPEWYVHMTKENQSDLLHDPTTLSKLMNRFAPFWDSNSKFGGQDGLKKAKVWIEKSPQNIVLSSFLEGVYNMPIQEDGSVSTQVKSGKKPITKFLFMTRHPIANVLATDIFIQESMGGFRDFEIMFRNYIQMHKYAQMDVKELDSPFMWAKLEDFVENPSKTLKRIFAFLELPNDDGTIKQILEEIGEIRSDPNAKYMAKWCAKDYENHRNLVEKYNDEIKSLDLGYDLHIDCS